MTFSHLVLDVFLLLIVVWVTQLTGLCLHLQHLACCCGRSPPTACPPTPALTCPKCTSCWRKTTVWTGQRAAQRRSTSSWGPVSCKTHLSRICLEALFNWKDFFYLNYLCLAVRLEVEPIRTSIFCWNTPSLRDHVPGVQHLWWSVLLC